MTTCVHCGKRKGKRTCPALSGTICPICCGQHRLREIDCPAGCVHLGGLAVVRDPDRGDAAFTGADYDAMFARLEDYAGGMGELGRAALRRLYDGRTEPADWEAPVGMGYLFYGHRDPCGQRMIDHFIAARGRGLRPAEAAAALALQRAWASLFEITAVHAGVGMELRDLRTGDSVTVREVTATSQLSKRDIVFTWIIEFPGRLELTGAACVVPRPDLDKVRAALDAELSRARREHPGVGDRELVGSVAWVVITTLRAALGDFRMPELQNTEGEALVLSKAHYAVLDEGAVRAALAAVPDLEADDEDFTWISRGGNDLLGPGSLTLGHVRIADGELGLAGDGDDTGDDDDDDDEALRYDAAQRPDAARWLALDDQVKARAVEAHHRELDTHPALPNPRMHALMHVIAENQLAGGSPPEARAALERLMGAGLSRHAAIHAIGSVVARAIWQALREHMSFDREANARALERLRPEGWEI